MRPSIAIDFDGTITADAKFPIIGEENMWVVGKLSEYSDEEQDLLRGDKVHKIKGDNIVAPATYVISKLSSRFEIIIHTCRTDGPQDMMVDWLSRRAHTPMSKGHHYYVNYNPNCREAYQKPFADVYLDNRGLTWHSELNVEEAIQKLISTLPAHVYIPQS